MKRISIFIDGNNFYHSLKKVYRDSKDLIDFNFEKFCKLIANERRIVEIFYYNAKLDRTKNPEKYKSQQKFFETLRKIPNFNLKLCKLVKRKIKRTGEFYYTIKEDDIHMAVDMLDGAVDGLFEIALLVSGDGDFVPAVKAVQRRGKQVENIYFKQTSSDNLKQNCDGSFRLIKPLLDKCFD